MLQSSRIHTHMQQAIRAAQFTTGEKSKGFSSGQAHITIMTTHKNKRTCRVTLICSIKEHPESYPSISPLFDGLEITLCYTYKEKARYLRQSIHEGITTFLRIPNGAPAYLLTHSE